MVKRRFSKEWLFYIVLILCLPAIHNDVTYASSSKSFVYDEANILTDDEIAKLDQLADQYSEKRETEFIILTTNDTDGKDIEQYLQDFYDANAPGYDRPHGNAAILALDVDVREVYVAGFYHAEKYLDNDRIDSLLDQITPDLSDEQYYEAFQSFITISNRYMGFKPGIDPEFIFFKWWFQLLVSIGVGALIVKMMLRHTGGKITVNERTYQDTNRSRVLQRRDHYVRKSVTRRRKPSHHSGGGDRSSGGGGITKGGHSHSGGRRSF